MMVIGAEATGFGSGLGSYPEQALNDAPTTPHQGHPNNAGEGAGTCNKVGHQNQVHSFYSTGHAAGMPLF